MFARRKHPNTVAAGGGLIVDSTFKSLGKRTESDGHFTNEPPPASKEAIQSKITDGALDWSASIFVLLYNVNNFGQV